jgi:pimeloyl-ACP methyl ester carboxylesterase
MPMRDGAGATRSPAETPTDTWVQGPAGRLRVSDGGSGPPVVLVHGLAGNVSYWTSQLDHLRRSRRAIAVELRGHGASDPAGDRHYSFDAFVGDIEAAVDALALPTFALVGHSLGAALVGEYAGRHPERVTSLVLVDPPGDLTRLPQEAIGQFLAALRSESYPAAIEQQYEMGLAQGEPGVRERVLANLRVTPREVVVGAYETMVVDPVPPLERYRAAGGRVVAVLADGNTGPIALPELMPDLPRRAITGTGHWLHMDRPEEFNRLLDEILAGDERSEE